MAADFWAGYMSGAVGIIVGNPLDIVKVRAQATASPILVGSRPSPPLSAKSAWCTGTAAPIIGYGALNALLFISYNRAEKALNNLAGRQRSPLSTWLAGAVGGLATWVISTPTELLKCRAQIGRESGSSWALARRIWLIDGTPGFYRGGMVTALRDSIGYGFYFWSYDLMTRSWDESSLASHDTTKILLCGGLAGIITWASVFPLDVLKTRIQTVSDHTNRKGALQLARQIYAEEGITVFFRGLAVCSARAFVVNAAQWSIYEWAMRLLSPP